MIGDATQNEPSKLGMIRTVMVMWLNLQLLQETEDDIRAGISFLVNAEGIGLKNFDTKTGRFMASNIQVSFAF